MEDYDGKVVIVTGASSGIGAGIAKKLASRKAQLVLTSLPLHAQGLADTARECVKLGSENVLQVTANALNPCDSDNIVSKTIAKFGQLDVLVNNAGIFALGGIKETDCESFNRIFDINVKAVVYLTQQAMEHLVKTRGNIVTISSVLSQRPFRKVLLYGMTKGALDTFTRSVAAEMAPLGVRANSVNPGVVENTNIMADLNLTPTQGEYMLGTISHPLGDVTVDDVADAVVFLASSAARRITGVNLIVDGGKALVGAD